LVGFIPVTLISHIVSIFHYITKWLSTRLMSRSVCEWSHRCRIVGCWFSKNRWHQR